MREMVTSALRGFKGRWHLVDGYALPRLAARIDLVLVTDRAVLVFANDRATADAAAIDLADFHAGCRGLPVLPVALLTGERVVAQDPLPFPGAAPCIGCSRLLLPGLLGRVAMFPVVCGFDPDGWESAAYRPVPALLQAAKDLFARHDVASLQLATSGRGTLDRTRAAIGRSMDAALAEGRKQVVFVTGEPGAGKTLCGLEVAFRPGRDSTFLSGNPALLHVLRAALVRDAAARGLSAAAAKQRVGSIVQPLHAFRDHYAAIGVPPDRVLVIDEAQRCWTASYAIRKSMNKPVRLHLSEPGHILEIMSRLDGGCVIVCILGGGQEIHAGEGGLAEWGVALAAHPGWHAAAPPGVLGAPDPRQRLPRLPGLVLDEGLHLGDTVRSYDAPGHVAWVNAVLEGDWQAARRWAGPAVHVTRSLGTMRAALATAGRRVGLVASAGGRRLRAEGLGGLLWHQDEDAVARWFLDCWPDIRSSDALEVAATEFGVQGLELDEVGVCWDLDLMRDGDDRGWVAQGFRATAWTRLLMAEALSNKRNAYRVLLTRARRRTVIWVPRGDRRDPTRDPDRYDAIAAFLLRCGALALGDVPVPERVPDAVLL